ncbi:hypothetical protein AKG39_05405 [Acetobacterium bakii]|uniref:Transposase InsH N-terminal domain-containing protein n=1 Tax=Acetobacterium bakii TaxID=52689 RepID=A0A0L6U2L6_9FIRM|nr:hypothetical protein AKG39_05405 [Acetobacterium bakii]
MKDTYCENFDRPAKEPELMCKLLFLQHIYNLSDEKVIVDASFNRTYLYFLDINPEDTWPERSLLSKFRKLKLGEQLLDEIIIEIVRQCVTKGILNNNSVSIDGTLIEELLKDTLTFPSAVQPIVLMKVNIPTTKIPISGSVVREMKPSAGSTSSESEKMQKVAYRKAIGTTLRKKPVGPVQNTMTAPKKQCKKHSIPGSIH